jgi:hypothetical protein
VGVRSNPPFVTILSWSQWISSPLSTYCRYLSETGPCLPHDTHIREFMCSSFYGRHMGSPAGVRRVVMVVLDGLRPDAIDAFDLANIDRLVRCGASSLAARTVDPSITTAALTSLMTGVRPERHGITGDRVFIPRAASGLKPLPEALAECGFPSSAFLAEVPTLFKGIGARVGRRLGFGTTRFVGRRAEDILAAARTTLRAQRRGLIVLHWPDADRAGHSHGWMSPAYAAGCRDLDAAIASLWSMLDLDVDASSMLVALADHGGGGASARDHESGHPLDVTIPLTFAGPAIAPGNLNDVTLLDVPATTLFALGVPIPASYEGQALSSVFTGSLATTAA